MVVGDLNSGQRLALVCPGKPSISAASMAVVFFVVASYSSEHSFVPDNALSFQCRSWRLCLTCQPIVFCQVDSLLLEGRP